jgi:hypothetical protein
LIAQHTGEKLFLSIWEGNWMPTHTHTHRKCLWRRRCLCYTYLSRIRHVNVIIQQERKHETHVTHALTVYHWLWQMKIDWCVCFL